jgi:hypothetical protein
VVPAAALTPAITNGDCADVPPQDNESIAQTTGARRVVV